MVTPSAKTIKFVTAVTLEVIHIFHNRCRGPLLAKLEIWNNNCRHGSPAAYHLVPYILIHEVTPDACSLLPSNHPASRAHVSSMTIVFCCAIVIYCGNCPQRWPSSLIATWDGVHATKTPSCGQQLPWKTGFAKDKQAHMQYRTTRVHCMISGEHIHMIMAPAWGSCWNDSSKDAVTAITVIC